jgi:hypothetical protein
MGVNSNSIKKEGEALQEAESVVKKQNVTMALDVFDCPVCSNPLRPPIFQVTECILVCWHRNSIEILLLARSFWCGGVLFMRKLYNSELAW